MRLQLWLQLQLSKGALCSCSLCKPCRTTVFVIITAPQPIDTSNDEGTLSQETILKIQELQRLVYRYPIYSNSDGVIKCVTYFSINGDNTILDENVELLDEHVFQRHRLPQGLVPEETTEGSGNGTVDEQRDIELESISNEASNAAAEKNKRPLGTNGSTTPKRYKRLKQDPGHVAGIETACLGVLALGNSQSRMLSKEFDREADQHAAHNKSH
jgi:hypothetical protein